MVYYSTVSVGLTLDQLSHRSICTLEWNPIQAAQDCPIVHFSFILMQTIPLCMCSFLEAKASFLNTTSKATTKESYTSNTSILRSASKQDKKGADLLKNPNRINQILCLEKGCKLLKLHTSCFLCFREMWKGNRVNQTIWKITENYTLVRWR